MIMYRNTKVYVREENLPFNTWTDTIVAAATFARAQL